MFQSALFKAEAFYSENDPDKDNFYSIIESAKDIIKDNDWWVVKWWLNLILNLSVNFCIALIL